MATESNRDRALAFEHGCPKRTRPNYSYDITSNTYEDRLSWTSFTCIYHFKSFDGMLASAWPCFSQHCISFVPPLLAFIWGDMFQRGNGRYLVGSGGVYGV